MDIGGASWQTTTRHAAGSGSSPCSACSSSDSSSRASSTGRGGWCSPPIWGQLALIALLFVVLVIAKLVEDD